MYQINRYFLKLVLSNIFIRPPHSGPTCYSWRTSLNKS